MPEGMDEVRYGLLSKAAEVWQASATANGPASENDPGAAVDDIPGFLGAYYRHVAIEDLTAAGPDRMAAVAARHAAVGRSRPQGRALVSARDAGGAALDGAGTVLDIVTDDMPYLVDSVTIDLNRHGADLAIRACRR
jgi:glutamate dehydrogenase